VLQRLHCDQRARGISRNTLRKNIYISGGVPDVVNVRRQGAYESFSKLYKIEELLVTVKRELSKKRPDADLLEGQTE
jgi:hypothetical protein